MPTFLDIQVVTWRMCSFQFKCSSIKTPKNFVWFLRSKGTPSMSMLFGRSFALVFDSLKWTKLVLLILRDNLLHLNHVHTLGIS